jgi:hypothetical protein
MQSPPACEKVAGGQEVDSSWQLEDAIKMNLFGRHYHRLLARALVTI